MKLANEYIDVHRQGGLFEFVVPVAPLRTVSEIRGIEKCPMHFRVGNFDHKMEPPAHPVIKAA